jgi:hypothetical protein
MKKIVNNIASHNDTTQAEISQAVLPFDLPVIEDKKVTVDFNGPSQSSDGGVLLISQLSGQVKIIDQMSRCITDGRDQRYTLHDLYALLAQRIYQIALGYEDANDSDQLRHDPALKMALGVLPDSGEALASQPTITRLENAVSRCDLYRIAQAFLNCFIDSYASEPGIIVLDFDDTESTTYGDQQLSLFNGYYGEYCFMPLHVYEGLSGKLITTILKPGKRSSGQQVLSILKRLVNTIRQRWPNTILVFRGDSHFCSPEIHQWIKPQENVHHVTGLSGNSKLYKQLEGKLKTARELFEYTGSKATLFHSFAYKADSWSDYQRVVAKIEYGEKGENIRFIVTDMYQAKAQVLFKEVYNARGRDELYIKEHKLYLKSDRTSCQRFEANQFRLFLHSAAYVLLHALKENLLQTSQLAKATFQTIRLKLFKVSAHIREMKTKVTVHFPRSYPYQKIFRQSFAILTYLRGP